MGRPRRFWQRGSWTGHALQLVVLLEAPEEGEPDSLKHGEKAEAVRPRHEGLEPRSLSLVPNSSPVLPAMGPSGFEPLWKKGKGRRTVWSSSCWDNRWQIRAF